MAIQGITTKVLKKIEEQKIMQRPRWHFVVRNVLVWVVGVIAVMIGSVAVSLIIFVLIHGAWGARGPLGYGRIEYLLHIFPVMWTTLFVLFIVLAEYAVRATKRGYKYSVTVLSLLIVGVSIVGGIFLYFIGVSQRADDVFGRHIPRYSSVEMRQQNILHHAKRGRVIGEITDIFPGGLTLYNAVEDQKYHVIIRNTENITSRKAMRVGHRVVVFGMQQKDGTIVAKRVVSLRKLHNVKRPQKLRDNNTLQKHLH